MPKGKVTFKDEDCKGCGLCVAFCPQKILVLNREKINPGRTGRLFRLSDHASE